MNVFINTLPVFVVIFLGYILSRLKFFDLNTTHSLARLTFYIIIPVTLFLDLATLPSQEVLKWSYLFAYFTTSIILITLSFIISRCYFKENLPNTIINAMGSTQTNTVFLALPLFVFVFNTVIPVAGIILVQSVFNFLIVFSMELLTSRKKQQSKLYTALSVLWKTPLLLGIILGIIFSIMHFNLPALFKSTFSIIKNSAAFIALLTLGLSLGEKGGYLESKEKTQLGIAVLFKSFLHPFMAFCVGRYIFHLSAQWLIYLTVMAAMPTAKNTYFVAKNYMACDKRANFIVIITTLLSVFIINLVLFLSLKA